MLTLINRRAEPIVLEDLGSFPVVAILGPRQCGKSTLAKMIGRQIRDFAYLDLESPSDLRKLNDPELYFELDRQKTVCLDEIQLKPDIFPALRSIVDRTGMKGQALLLGSASRNLINQGAESLAGGISFVELTPFLISEVEARPSFRLIDHWFRGGYPDSFLAADDRMSTRWRNNFLRTYTERDIPQLGFRVTAVAIRRLLTMLAHSHGQVLNSSKIGASLGLSYHTIRSYIDLLEQTFVVRTLPSFETNIKKRVIKSPKVYVRDSGLLHAILEVPGFDELMGHPAFGASWEGFALENILSELYDWHGYFYRTASGNEIDLILAKGRERLAVEFKSSKAPTVTKGFWTAMDDLGIKEGWVIAPVDDTYPIREGVHVSPLGSFVRGMRGR
jgi:uncharacterized protein